MQVSMWMVNAVEDNYGRFSSSFIIFFFMKKYGLFCNTFIDDSFV